jgi:HK97 family phage portal protein
MGLVSGAAAAPGTALMVPGTGVTQAQARELWGISNPMDLVPRRQAAGAPLPVVNEDTALRNSAVWACLRMRADLISTFPVNVFRMVRQGDGSSVPVSVPTPRVLASPDGPGSLWPQWCFASQWDLDRTGNSIGLITERDGNGLPTVIELQSATSVSVLMNYRKKIVGYRIAGNIYDPADVWHEKQFVVGGFPLGLSPVAYAAWQALSRAMTIDQFAIGWFAGGGVPRARLRNLNKPIPGAEADVVKEAWLASIATGEPFVHGTDWEYDLLQANEAGSSWLDAQKAGVVDVARYFGCPADLIDAAVTGAARITYANVAQRHVQLLVLNIGPAVVRREAALSTLVQAPRYVKLNTKALMRLDPLTQAQMLDLLVRGKQLAPSEAREFDDRPPFTQAQIDELDHFFPPTAPPLAPAPVDGVPQAPYSEPVTGPGTAPGEP